MALEDDLTKPKRVKTPNLEVEHHSLADRLAAEDDVAANKGVKGKYRGLRFSKFTLPSQIGNQSATDETV